ncbi:hypothetical protein BDN70DRAFT_993159 [Pholiota conissans]|uniref:Nephrocystin 3-like N-terminal domain-containing protein n=1 Tax=Pholiota conissans TaxID=109636 RepID=A0A9P5Z4G6_9AGAR|nr:hypothetical protein BDN70DRAFT_993159 [Pholiota conissans]
MQHRLINRQPASTTYGLRMRPEISVPSTSTHMFGGDNIAISGGQFYQAENIINHNHNHTHNCTMQGIDPLLHLLEHVSSSAFHNSAERFDPPRCHPNTRVEILEKIRDWAIQYGFDRKSWILWLNGAAGAGKSAIMQSIAELLLLQYSFVAVASFFFSRGDSTRNTIAPLVSTLAYQLIQEIPETSEFILSKIAHNPLIFRQTLDYQLQQLIIQPLINLPFHMRKLFVIFIDGLDECLDQDHQVNLIKVAGNIYIGKDIPLAFVIASRREPQIQFGFNQETVSHILENIPLDDSKASDDIRHYLNAKFADIKKTHIYRQSLPPKWPSVSTVTKIVEKSSNQFIYASTVINYISSPRADPACQLKVVHNLSLLNPSSQHPFAHLDSLYQHIFSQVKNLDQVLDILAFDILNTYGVWSGTTLDRAFFMEPNSLQILFQDLTAVIQVEFDGSYTHLSFLHKSLPDFLQDPVRSQKYFLDLEKYHTKLLCMFLGYSFLETPSSNNTDKIAEREYYRLLSIEILLMASPIPSDQLQQAFINFDSISLRHGMDEKSANISVWILDWLKRADFGDNGQAYQHILNLLAEGLAHSWTSYGNAKFKEYMKDLPDLCARIRELQPKLARLPSLNSLDSDEENPSHDDDIDDSISDE